MPKSTKLNRKARRILILERAKAIYESEGSIEIDEGAKLSEGDDNGTYVQAWVWVPFSGTVLCKGEGSSNEGRYTGSHDDCEEGCPVWDKAVAAA